MLLDEFRIATIILQVFFSPKLETSSVEVTQLLLLHILILERSYNL